MQLGSEGDCLSSEGQKPGSSGGSSGSRGHELGSEGDHLSSGVNEQGSRRGLSKFWGAIEGTSLGRRLRLDEDHLSFGWPLFGGHNLWYQLAEDKTLKPAYNTELWVRVLFLCSHFFWPLVVMFLCLYTCAIRGCSLLIPKRSPLG